MIREVWKEELHTDIKMLPEKQKKQKKKSHFAAYLLMEAQDGKANFSLEFPKKKNEK